MMYKSFFTTLVSSFLLYSSAVFAIDPVLIGRLDMGGAHDVVVVKNLAYVAAKGQGLKIINVANPAKPVLVGRLKTGDANGVVVAENYAYVADGGQGLKIINVVNPRNPALVGSVPTSDAHSVKVDVNRGYAYVADGSEGLKIINIANPARPILVENLAERLNIFAMSVVVVGNYAYVADFGEGLKIIDISDPSRPVLVGKLVLGDKVTVDVTVVGNYAYVASFGKGLKVINITDKINPILVGGSACLRGEPAIDENNVGMTREEFESFYMNVHGIVYPMSVIIVGNYAYAANYNMLGEGGGFKVFNTSNIKFLPLEGVFRTEKACNTYRVAVDGNYAYVADAEGLKIVELERGFDQINSPILSIAPELKDLTGDQIMKHIGHLGRAMTSAQSLVKRIQDKDLRSLVCKSLYDMMRDFYAGVGQARGLLDRNEEDSFRAMISAQLERSRGMFDSSKIEMLSAIDEKENRDKKDIDKPIIKDVDKHIIEVAIHGIQKVYDAPSYEDSLDDLKQQALQDALPKVLSLIPQTNRQPTCFISYAWGNYDHEKMVHCLYEQLKKAGIKAHLDIEDNSRGRIGTYIDLINTDDYVVVVGTPELRQKWDKTTKGEKGGVLATELGMVRNKFTEQPNAIIPVLIEGTKESFPPFIVDVVYSNLSDRAIYYKNLFGVIENLYEGIKEIQPQIKEARAIFEQIEKDVMRAKSPEKIKEILNNVSMKYDPPKYELPKEPAQKKTKM